jgi:hypothetical protein
MIVMRNSREPHGRVLRYTAEEWQSFVRAVKGQRTCSIEDLTRDLRGGDLRDVEVRPDLQEVGRGCCGPRRDTR